MERRVQQGRKVLVVLREVWVIPACLVRPVWLVHLVLVDQ